MATTFRVITQDGVTDAEYDTFLAADAYARMKTKPCEVHQVTSLVIRTYPRLLTEEQRNALEIDEFLEGWIDTAISGSEDDLIRDQLDELPDQDLLKALKDYYDDKEFQDVLEKAKIDPNVIGPT